MHKGADQEKFKAHLDTLFQKMPTEESASGLLKNLLGQIADSVQDAILRESWNYLVDSGAKFCTSTAATVATFFEADEEKKLRNIMDEAMEQCIHFSKEPPGVSKQVGGIVTMVR